MEKITSVQNLSIKRIARLRTKKTREAKGITLVEGIREVRQALSANLTFVCVYICREGVYACDENLIKDLQAQSIQVIDCSCVVFDKMSYGDRKEGIIALVRTPHKSLEQIVLPENPLVMVIERVEKPGNLGALLRTADGAGVNAVLVCDEMTDLYNPNIIRSSLGAVFTVPVVTCTNQQALLFLQQNQCHIFAAIVQAQDVFFTKDMSMGTAIVLGSEQKGLSEFWQQNAHTPVLIPMKGRLDSLNVSVAGAILLYEALRQRSQKG